MRYAEYYGQESELKAVEDHLSVAKEENEALQERASVADAAVSDPYVVFYIVSPCCV